MTHAMASPQPPWEVLAANVDPLDDYRHGMTDQVALDGFTRVVRGLVPPDAQGMGWAEWLVANGRIYLQAGSVEFVSDNIAVPHPQILAVARDGPVVYIEPQYGDLRHRHPDKTVAMMRDMLNRLLTAPARASADQENAA